MRHKWKYGVGAKWSRRCLNCGVRERYRKRLRGAGMRHVYGEPVPQLQQYLSGGWRDVDTTGPCSKPGGR